MGQFGPQALLKKILRVTQDHFRKQHKPPTIIVIPNTEIRQGCSVQALLTFPLFFRLLRILISRSGLTWGILLRIKHSLINELQAVYEPLVPLDITTEGINFFSEIISHESVLLIIIHHYISSHVGATVRYQKLLKIFIRCFYIYFKITNIFIFIRKSQKYIYIVFQNISAIAFFC